LDNSTSVQVLLQQDYPGDGTGLASGLVMGLLIAIPLWVLIGIALVFTLQEGPMNEWTSLAFMSAAACEAILARHALPDLRQQSGRYAFFAWPRNQGNDSHENTVRGIAGAVANTLPNLRRVFGARLGVNPRTRFAAVRTSTLRQTTSFAALAIAYLQYYFLSVSLQIASMPSVTVFVAVTPLQNIAT
jgi:hypothetical protein